jgi:cyclophilin family peptidyl-prolyl cis-trans isomerase
MSSRSTGFSTVSRRAKPLASCLLMGLLASVAVPGHAQSSQDPIYTFHTNLGDMRVQLYPDVTPQTVANFVTYINSNAYNNSFFHRSVPGFIIQGGGYTVDANINIYTIPTTPPVINEFHLSNTRGTIAMAKLGGEPNSATDEWFFNEGDNSANLDNQDGGFTVFGKVADSASLAIMDQIAAVPVPNPSPYAAPFDEIPLMNYNTSQGVQLSNFVLVTSITPPSNWRPVSVSTGTDGYTRILWDNLNGTASVWKVNSSGGLVTQQQFGPYAGWTAKAISTGKDNQTRLLWTNTGGTAAYYLLDANNAFVSQQQYGPYSGWTAQGLAVAPDNSVRALWTNTDGTATVWTLDGTNHLTTQQQYGPYYNNNKDTSAGYWAAQSLSVNPDGSERLLWDNTNGTATFWKLNSGSQLQSQVQYGPYTGYTASSIASAPDGTGRVVWAGTDAHISLWTIDGSNAYTGQQTQFGPYSGWYFQGVGIGSDGNARLLWGNYSGQSALWSITSSGSFAANTQFGPY